MSKYDLDWEDSKQVWKFTMKNVEIADDYAKARQDHAIAVKTLKLALAKQYKEQPELRKMSEEKAYLIIAEQSVDHRNMLRQLIDTRALYKGLEKILEVRQAAVSFNQSLIKNRVNHA